MTQKLIICIIIAFIMSLVIFIFMINASLECSNGYEDGKFDFSNNIYIDNKSFSDKSNFYREGYIKGYTENNNIKNY